MVWAPVNNSKLGATAERRLAAHAPTIAGEDQPATSEPVGERDRHQRHQHPGAGDGERHAERLIRLTEGTRDRVAVLRQQRAAEVGDQRGTRASAQSRAACSGVNGTGGTTGRSFNGGGSGCPWTAACSRAAAWGSARRAPSQAWKRRNQVKNGTVMVLAAVSCSSTGPSPGTGASAGAAATKLAASVDVVSGIPSSIPA